MKTVPNVTRTEFADVDGSGMIVEGVKSFGTFAIKFANTYREFPTAQAPAVALAVLTAAGFVPRGNRRDSDSFQESVDTAAGYLDDAVRLQAGTAAKAELTRRRDELAKDFIRHLPDLTYDKIATAGIKRAIDMIITLQDEAKK